MKFLCFYLSQYGDIYNFPQQVFNDALRAEEVEEKTDDEEEQDEEEEEQEVISFSKKFKFIRFSHIFLRILLKMIFGF